MFSVVIPLPCIPHRYLVAIEGFLALVVSYMMRFCITIILPEIVKPHMVYDKTCNFSHEEEQNKTFPYHWSNGQISLIHSSFFFGYCINLIPAGIMSDYVGFKKPMVLSLVFTGATTVAHPYLTKLFGVWGMISARFVVGLIQAVGYVSMHTLVAVWIPDFERATWGTIVFSGIYIGNALNFGISGLILKKIENGWVFLFYAYGTLGIVLGFLIIFTAHNRPEDNNFMSEKESRIMAQHVETIVDTRFQHIRPPLLEIFSNGAVWSLIIAMFGHGWGLFLFLTALPMFMKAVLDYNVQSNGMINAVTNILVWIISILSGILFDYTSNRKLLSRTWNRKIGTIMSSIIPGCGLLLAGHTNCNKDLALASLVIGISFLGFFYPSLKINPIDLSPNYAATIGSIAHFSGALAGILVGYSTPFITPQNTMFQWRQVFWLGAGISVFTCVYYVAFASAELQEFDELEGTFKTIKKNVQKIPSLAALDQDRELVLEKLRGKSKRRTVLIL